jgi:DNA-binding response OmpR family regulator
VSSCERRSNQLDEIYRTFIPPEEQDAMRVMVICDDIDLSDYLSYLARRAGFDVRYRSSVKAWLDDQGEIPADLILLYTEQPQDQSPGIRGLRAVVNTPILALTHDPDEGQLAALLDAGADTVLALPVGPKLCLACMQALLRRTRSMPVSILPTLDFGSIRLTPGSRSVEVDGRSSSRLTQLEFRLLYLLMTHPGQVIPGDVIVDRVWGYGESGSKELVRGLISRLRAKVEPDPSQPRYIHTIPAVGYLFEPGSHSYA